MRHQLDVHRCDGGRWNHGRDPERNVAIDVTDLDLAGEDAVVTEALRELRRSALRCRRARLLLDVDPVVVAVDATPVIAS